MMEIWICCIVLCLYSVVVAIGRIKEDKTQRQKWEDELEEEDRN